MREMRVALAVLVLVVCVQAVQGQNPYDPRLAVGTIDKFDGERITVNRLNGGEPLTFKIGPSCKYRIDGVTVEASKIKVGMKVVVEGERKPGQVDLVLAFVKDPLPRKR